MLVDRPDVVDAGVLEQRDVHGVVGVVVAQDHVGDPVGLQAECPEGIQDRRPVRDHSRVHDRNQVPVTDAPDGAGDLVGGVAGEEHVHGRHKRSLPVAKFLAASQYRWTPTPGAMGGNL
jgi:hypothetical protein